MGVSAHYFSRRDERGRMFDPRRESAQPALRYGVLIGLGVEVRHHVAGAVKPLPADPYDRREVPPPD